MHYHRLRSEPRRQFPPLRCRTLKKESLLNRAGTSSARQRTRVFKQRSRTLEIDRSVEIIVLSALQLDQAQSGSDRLFHITQNGNLAVWLHYTAIREITDTVLNEGELSGNLHGGVVNNGNITGGVFYGTVTGGTISDSLYKNVTFDSGDDNAAAPQRVLQGQPAQRPADPIKDS